MSPMSWYGGNQKTPTVSDVLRMAAAMPRKLWRSARWVSTTPLGDPVDPEVY